MTPRNVYVMYVCICNINVDATLIDNIFTKEINRDITSGLLIVDISDHLPVFVICRCDSNNHNRSGNVRYIRHANVESINLLNVALSTFLGNGFELHSC